MAAIAIVINEMLLGDLFRLFLLSNPKKLIIKYFCKELLSIGGILELDLNLRLAKFSKLR